MQIPESQNWLQVQLRRDGRVSRRRFLRLSGAALGSAGLLGNLGLYADQVRKQGRSCILLWLSGGPSQFETWDPKPGHEHGGQTKPIATAVPGVQIAQYWPQTARLLRDVALVRSLTNKEGSHDRATYQLHTGRRPTGALKFPNFGSVVAHQLGDSQAELPNFVSIGETLGSGFLGVDVQPFVVSRPGSLPDNVAAAVPEDRLRRRLQMLYEHDSDFAGTSAPRLADEHQGLYQQAVRMMLSPKLKAFQLDDEPPQAAEAYGTSIFGRGCLVARRLVEQGVPFIEVRRGGWDNHQDIYERMPALCAEVDQAMAALVQDLKSRGLLERTLVVCLGEFGRTPKINPRAGRDHWPRSFSMALAGAGIRGGQVVGSTTADGTDVAQRPVLVEDLFQTFCRALGIRADTELYTPSGRPLKIVDGGTVVSELFA